MLNQEMISAITSEVVAKLRMQLQQPALAQRERGPGQHGVFEKVNDAVEAAYDAQKKIADLSLSDRGRIVQIIRNVCSERAQELARMELDETKVGRLDHKIAKLENVRYVLGVEVMRSDARSDVSGLCLIERAPWGVIGMALPVTHSVPTMASNAINVIAAGNTAVFAPHPSGCKVAAYALQIFNREIERELGIANTVTTVREPSIEAAEQLFGHTKVSLLCVTGGRAVVEAASKYGKRVIAAGPGNPPVVVDETADFDAAAKAIIAGAAFDNNLLCIGEKEVFVVEAAANAFITAMKKAGAYQLDSSAIEKLSKAAFTFEGGGKGCGQGCGRAHVKKDLVGKDVAVLAAAAGVKAPAGTELLFGETNEEHPFVQEEQMMPFLPVVRVRDFEAGMAASLNAEHGYGHTALIHSRRMERVTEMARVMNTTLFINNAPCYAALGSEGPGYLSYTIATPTGEGVTTPLTFTRERQLTLGKTLRII